LLPSERAIDWGFGFSRGELENELGEGEALRIKRNPHFKMERCVFWVEAQSKTASTDQLREPMGIR
jgi:hypothetical protein